MTSVRVATGDEPVENAGIVAEEMHRWLRESEGFQGLLFLARDGAALVLTFWENEEVARRHAAVRALFRERISAVVGVQVEEVTDYSVAFADLTAL